MMISYLFVKRSGLNEMHDTLMTALEYISSAYYMVCVMHVDCDDSC